MRNEYGLPDISIELKEYSVRINYKTLYLDLIDKYLTISKDDPILSGYNEEHHILPKCMNGSNDLSNLVVLPIREHIRAHICILLLLILISLKLFLQQR